MSTYTPELAARLTAEALFQSHEDVVDVKRVVSRVDGVPRYSVLFRDGERYTVEVAFDGREGR